MLCQCVQRRTFTRAYSAYNLRVIHPTSQHVTSTVTAWQRGLITENGKGATRARFDGLWVRESDALSIVGYLVEETAVN